MRLTSMALVTALAVSASARQSPPQPFTITARPNTTVQYYLSNAAEFRLLRLDVAAKPGTTLPAAQLEAARAEIRRELEDGFRSLGRPRLETVNLRVTNVGGRVRIEANNVTVRTRTVQEFNAAGQLLYTNPTDGTPLFAYGGFDLVFRSPLPYGPLPAVGVSTTRTRFTPLEELQGRSPPENNAAVAVENPSGLPTRFTTTFQGRTNDGLLVFNFTGQSDPTTSRVTAPDGNTRTTDISALDESGTVRYRPDGLPHSGTRTRTARTRTVADLGPYQITAEYEGTYRESVSSR